MPHHAGHPVREPGNELTALVTEFFLVGRGLINNTGEALYAIIRSMFLPTPIPADADEEEIQAILMAEGSHYETVEMTLVDNEALHDLKKIRDDFVIIPITDGVNQVPQTPVLLQAKRLD